MLVGAVGAHDAVGELEGAGVDGPWVMCDALGGAAHALIRTREGTRTLRATRFISNTTVRAGRMFPQKPSPIRPIATKESRRVGGRGEFA